MGIDPSYKNVFVPARIRDTRTCPTELREDLKGYGMDVTNLDETLVIDIFLYEDATDPDGVIRCNTAKDFCKLRKKPEDCCDLYKADVVPLKRKPFEGFNFSVPKSSKKILRRAFGSWSQPPDSGE